MNITLILVMKFQNNPMSVSSQFGTAHLVNLFPFAPNISDKKCFSQIFKELTLFAETKSGLPTR